MDRRTDDVSHLLAEAAGGVPAQPPGAMPSTSGRPTRARLLPAARILAICLAALGFAALLNADHLVDRADRQPFGEKRDFWLATWEPVQELSDGLYLNRPRRWLDKALGREIKGTPLPLIVTPPARLDGPLTVQAAVEADRPGPVDAPGATVEIPAEIIPAIHPPARRLRKPTPEEPLRLFIAGDSMGAAFGGSLSRIASATGLIKPELDARASTGLTRPDFFDWPGRLLSVAQDGEPDVFVVMFGANDSQGLRTPEGAVFQPLSDGWRAEYRRRVAATMDLLRAPNRVQVWVGQPIMESNGLSEKVADINTIYHEEAALRPGAVLFVDSWGLFADSDGHYAAYLPDADGAIQGMRAGDGIHLTRAGADRLAAAVLARLDEETGVLSQ
jgi:uncharacterized protein